MTRGSLALTGGPTFVDTKVCILTSNTEVGEKDGPADAEGTDRSHERRGGLWTFLHVRNPKSDLPLWLR